MKQWNRLELDSELGNGRADTITAAAFYSDASTSRLVVGESSGNGSVWELGTTRWNAIARFKHGTSITVAKFDANGRRVATGSEDGMLCIWECDKAGNGNECRINNGGSIRDVAFAHGGRTLATAGKGGTSLWTISKTTELPLRFNEVKSDLQTVCVALSPNGELLLSGGEDWNAYLIDIAKQRVVRTFHHEMAVAAVGFGSDNLSVLTGSSDTITYRWDIATGHRLGPGFIHDGGVRVVASVESNNTPLMLTVDDRGTIRYWELPALGSQDVYRLRRIVERRTLRTHDGDGELRWLTPNEWRSVGRSISRPDM